MASSSQANEVCSFVYKTDDFTFEERSSMYELQLERQREDRKVHRGLVIMLGFNRGPKATRNHDDQDMELWEKTEASPSEERTSILRHLLRERGTQESKSLLHRLIFLAKISPHLADKRNLAEHWEQLFASLHRYHYQGEGVTGLLLLYPAYIVHILESSSEMLYSVLRDLRDIEEQQRPLVLEARILVMSHNLPSRLFQQWNYKVLNVPETHLGYDSSHEEPVEAVICECLTTLLKLGKHLQKYPKSSPNLPDTVLAKASELIIPQDSICHLLECQELLTPAQYLHLYDSPVDIQMDSETVWPLPQWVKPRLE